MNNVVDRELLLKNLADIRREFEESTPEDEWPEAALGELLLLADICQCESVRCSEKEMRFVLGPIAWIGVFHDPVSPVRLSKQSLGLRVPRNSRAMDSARPYTRSKRS